MICIAFFFYSLFVAYLIISPNQFTTVLRPFRQSLWPMSTLLIYYALVVDGFFAFPVLAERELLAQSHLCLKGTATHSLAASSAAL